MKTCRSWLSFSATALVVAILSGCGNSDLPSTSSVKGHVTYEGKPLADAMVIFSRGSRRMAEGEIALGRTDANGNFELTTHVSGQADVKGAVPSNYEVTISKKVPPKGISEADYQARVDALNKASEEGSSVAPGKEPPPLVELLPRDVSVPGSSKLTAEVKSNEMNDFQFDL
ncbi:hypothetical protein AB1L30_15140 [Bremerella sp. JC817]|uniref:hypothetical protein n=1 Tax=Bremerella sp. JC817 TaxID=3231756 RepID=UPI00345A4E5C